MGKDRGAWGAADQGVAQSRPHLGREQHQLINVWFASTFCEWSCCKRGSTNICFRFCFSVFWGVYSVVQCLTFWETIILFSQKLHHFTLPPARNIGSSFSMSLSMLVIYPVFLFPFQKSNSHPTRHEVLSHCGFICTAVMTSDIEHLFTYLPTICVSSSGKCPFKSFAHYPIVLVGFVVVGFGEFVQS